MRRFSFSWYLLKDNSIQRKGVRKFLILNILITLYKHILRKSETTDNSQTNMDTLRW